MLKLWAKRFDSAYGWRWHLCRDVDASNGAQWLAVFQKDEPKIEFVISATKPRLPSKV